MTTQFLDQPAPRLRAIADQVADAGITGAYADLLLLADVLDDPGAWAIVLERRRQQRRTFDADHDDQHVHGELLDAARSYLIGPTQEHAPPPARWPWHRSCWKPNGYLRNLERAGALVAAEISRVRRLHDRVDEEVGHG